MSDRIYMNNGWEFTEQFTDELLKETDCGQKLQQIRLPHTCKETPLHYFDEHCYQMVSGYRKVFFAPEEWQGKSVMLTFEGVAHDSEVFLNGEKAGEHHCGYTAFTVDLSKALHYGEKNVLTVKVDSRESLNIPPFGFVIDYMTYGGIYRDVYLEVKNECHLLDLFVKGNRISVKEQKAELVSEVSVNEPKDGLFVKQSIRKWQTGEYEVLGEVGVSGEKVILTFPIEQVQFWNTKTPHLYELKTELICEGNLIDEKEVRFGFQNAEFRKDGFYLNGEKIKIRGLNRHQSYPYVGYAMPESMQRMDADILKHELGVNAVRTSHYPQSHYFLDRCDELGLLVFTEIPGWQHIGDAAWKDQAVENVKDMILQYRNHTSIVLWGVRINESVDDDEFYRRTNEAAHQLDDTRPTGGVRANKKSSLQEDVYTYNDFIHDGKAKGCEKKAAVTSDVEKPYLVSEYNGHMYPTKAFDCEEHRLEHALRHANVLDAVTAEEDIAGSFGWCMFDYNTHKDFGSGDRICYHGVMDMFRNPKLAAEVYASEQENRPVLALSSAMDIGEHPACNRGETYIFTNADKVRMYKNDRFLKEYTAADSKYKSLHHGPIAIDDYIGDALKAENISGKKEELVKKVLNAYARYGMSGMPKKVYLTALWLILRYHMSMEDAVQLYTKYVGDWGGSSTSYRLEAVMVDRENGSKEKTKEEIVVKTLTIEPMKQPHLEGVADHTELMETHSYDVAAVRICAKDENGNILPFFNEPVTFRTEGPITLIGPKTATLQGGMGGTYVKTTGETGKATLTICNSQTEDVRITFQIGKREEPMI